MDELTTFSKVDQLLGRGFAHDGWIVNPDSFIERSKARNQELCTVARRLGQVLIL